MKDKVQDYRERQERLARNIQICKEYKRKVIEFVSELNEQLRDNTIGYEEYKERLNKHLEGRKAKQWLSYYDGCIDYYRRRITYYSGRIEQLSKVRIAPIIMSVLLLIALIGGAFFLKPVITGYVVKEISYAQELDLTIDQTGEHLWQPEYLGELESVKISGSIVGEGSVKVYIEDKLILDSDLLKEKTETTMPKITGAAVTEETINTSEDVINETVSEDITDVNETTPGPEDITGETEENITESIENMKEEEYQSEEILIIDNQNITNITEEPENITKEENITEETPSIENITEEIVNITLPENVTEDITLPTETPNVTVPEIVENITPTNITLPEMPENVTNITAPEEIPITKNITEITFTGVCIETCDLTGLGLNKSSYKLRFEVENAILKIDTISYTIKTLEENITAPVVPVIENVSRLEETIQESAEINKPVKWIKEVRLNKSVANLTVKLPKNIFDVKVSKIIDDVKKEISPDKLKLREAKQVKKLQESLITKEVIKESEEVKEESEEVKEESELIIEESVKEIEVEYYTEAPQITEKEINENKKEITIYSDVHYENVLAYTTITESPKDLIRLYRTTGGIRELTEITDYTDEDNDGLIDRISWIVPSLSNQTYELIIEISAAEHLDENRNFLSNIYNKTYQLDNIWSETIPTEHYVRVTFEKELDNTRDITLYPRTVSGNPRIEVYEVNGTEKIAEFTNLEDNQYNKVYLTGLEGTQDTFDLRVLNGNIEIDHIIDPVTPPVTDDFEVGFGNWTSVDYDDVDWTRLSGATGSSNTGPSSAHGGSYYIYTETSSPNGLVGQIYIVEGPELDADTYNINISFWYHMYLNNSVVNSDTRFSLDINDSNGWNNEVWVKVGGQGNQWSSDTVDLSSFSGIIKPRFKVVVGSTGSVSGSSYYRNDIALDDINIIGTLANAKPSDPTNITCDSSNNCNVSVTQGNIINLTGTGSTDTDGDTITYFIEASLTNVTTFTDGTDVSKTGEEGPGPAEGINRTLWTKEASAGCNSGWTANSGWEDAEFRFFIDDLVNTSDFDKIRIEFCAGTDEILRVVNVSICWYDGPRPAATNTACTDALTQIDGEGTANGWIYSEIAAGACEFTPWFTYAWNGSRNYFVQWGACPEGGTCSYGGNRYQNTCSDTDLSRIDATTADVMNPSWASDAWDGYSYDLQSIEGNTTESGASTTNETDTTYTTYNDVASDFKNITNITVKVEVDSYDSKASDNQGTNDPDLVLEISNSTDWIVIGNFTLPDTYGDGFDATNHNFSLSTTDTIILTAWQTSSNQDLRIRGRYMDYNGSLPDEINYTNVWVTIDGGGWIEIGNHTNTTTLEWNTTDIAEQTCVDLRARAIDIAGTNSYSNYFTKGCCLNISHAVEDITPPKITILRPLNQTYTDSTTQWINVSASEDISVWIMNWNGTNMTFTPNMTFIFNESQINLTIYANDTANNWDWENVTFKIDASAPIILVDSPANNTYDTNTIFINASASEDISGWIYNINGTNYTLGSINTSITVNDGQYQLKLYANDSVDNWGLNDSVYFAVDTAAAPQIDDISDIPAQSITEGSITGVLFYVVVTDLQGTADISSVNATFTRSGEATRFNSSCSKVGDIDSDTANYSCTINIWYWDGAGTWNVNATATDTTNAYSAPYNETFTLQETTAFVRSPVALTWASLTPGNTNQTSNNDPVTLNNTANKDITDGNIEVNATDLLGESDSSKAILAANFTVDIDTGGTPPAECNGTQLVNITDTGITGATLSAGNVSAGDGQEELYYCLTRVAAGLTSQTYSTLNGGSWTIKIT